MKNKKKLRIFLSVSVFFIAAVILLFAQTERLAIKHYVSEYENSKSVESLCLLCDSIVLSEDYDAKIKYLPQYLSDNNVIEYIKPLYSDKYLLDVHLTDYSLQYCLAFLHTDRLSDFETAFNKLMSDTEAKEVIYYALASDLNSSEYNENQLECLSDVLKKNDIQNDVTHSCNSDLQFVIKARLSAD